MAFLGPDTAALGERSHIRAVTQSQIAATLAALLGEDYNAAVSKAGKPAYGMYWRDESERVGPAARSVAFVFQLAAARLSGMVNTSPSILKSRWPAAVPAVPSGGGRRRCVQPLAEGRRGRGDHPVPRLAG